MQKYFLRSPRTAEEFSAYYNFRWQHLRQPLNMPAGSEQDSNEGDSFHCMAVCPDQTIIGVGRINQESLSVMRIRYMAVNETMQGMGVGSAILSELLNYAKSKHANLCWLNARKQACGFYQKHGFEIVGQTETGLNIPHCRMVKHLGP